MRASSGSSATDTARAARIVLARDAGRITAAMMAADGTELGREILDPSDLSAWVAAAEREAAPRWVWSDTPQWYPALLDDGVAVGRCHDLRLCHAVLAGPTGTGERPEWSAVASVGVLGGAPTLFEMDPATTDLPADVDAVLAELRRQSAQLAAAGASQARLRLLLAAESAGALAAAEMHAAGVPWDVRTHDHLLTEALGARGPAGSTPERLARLAAEVRAELEDPGLRVDSPPRLLRALRRAGVQVESTAKWELVQQRHPVIPPLLEYKRLSRLHTANGWAWLTEWVRDGRFRPVYVPGGVVTGRWASSGGGALQLPRQLRSAVRAEPGWRLVVADVAQLEPRILAAMASDHALADDGRDRDLYAGIVERGAVGTRAEAKIAMLGAMYGATTGQSGMLVPRLRRAYPRAMALVDDAARTGEKGGVVSTWLGRRSPAPSDAWRSVQAAASSVEATSADQARARRDARDRGRFTRNFVVQGTAAEWALVWIAELRRRLTTLPEVAEDRAAQASGPFARRAHLAFFLHDEIIVHTPAEMADAVAREVAAAAVAATQLLFGSFPIDIPLEVTIADTAAKG